MIDVLVPATGSPFLDVVFTGLPRVPVPGEEVVADDVAFVPGGSLTAAIVLTRLGYKVLYEARLGRDFASSFLLAAMETEGMSTEAVVIDDDARACVTVAYNHGGDRSFLTYAHPSPPPDPLLVDTYQPRAVLVDGLRVGESCVEVLRRAKKIGALRLADVQDTAPTLAETGTRELLSEIDVINLNEREAKRLTGAAELETALAVLADIIPTVVLKKGAAGSAALWAWGHSELPAIPTDVLDLTGCGDNYFGALTAALLDGCVMEECLAWGNCAGHLAAQHPGGTAGRYDKATLTKLVERHYGDLIIPDPLRNVQLEPTER
ncbi:MAG: carbohydrate kinase family protein [Candidatus Lernaella stagnicola]|nr:carbohydrate kinase family protein [Candidatus Lernaella stagnicola]